MNARRSGRPAAQHVRYPSRQPAPPARTLQSTQQTIPPLNSTIQARYQTLMYPDRTGLPPTSVSQTAGVSPPIAVPMVDPGLQSRTNAPSSPSVTDYLTSTLHPMFTAHQEATSARIHQIGSVVETLVLTIGNLSTEMKDSRREALEHTKQATEMLERTHEVQLSTSRVLTAQLAKLEKIIGTSSDEDGKKSLLNRLDDITYAVEECLERVKDLPVPRAGANSAINLKAPGVQGYKTYADVAVDRRTPEFNPRSHVDTRGDFQTPEPTLDHHASLPKQLHKDVGINSRTPEPAPTRYEFGTSTTRQVYADAAVYPKTPEPLPTLPARHEFGTSPVRQSYFNAATAPRTPSPLVSIRASTHLTNLNAHRFSSGALNLVRGATNSEVISHSGLVHHVEMDPVIIEEDSFGTPGMNPRSFTAPIQAHFTHVPEASKSLSPADWSMAEKTCQASTSNADNGPDEPTPIFNPDPSPSATQNFTLLREEFNPPEGSVRSLRLTALGDSLAGPTTSSPPQAIPIIPISSPPSVSPPSPYSLSPSCSPRILSPPPRTPQDPRTPRSPTPVEGHSNTTSTYRYYAQASPSPIQVFTPELAPVVTEAETIEEAPRTSITETLSTLVTSYSSPVMAPTPAQTSTQGSVEQIQESLLMSSPNNQVSPNPVEEEIPISQLLTESFTSLEAPSITPDLIPQSHLSQDLDSVPHVSYPVIPGEPPVMSSPPSSPPLPSKVFNKKLPLLRTLPPLKNPIKPPFIDLRGSPSSKPYPSHNSQSPHLTLATMKTVKTPRTPRLPKASASKMISKSPIYVSSRSLSPVSDLTSQSESDDVKVIPVKKIKTDQSKSELPPPKKYLIMKVDPPEKESAAATRVKKRKAKPSDVASEPPLKRARQKAEVKGEIVEIERKDFDSKAKGKGKGKETKGKDSGKDTKGKQNTSTISSAKSSSAKKAKARAKPLTGSEWPPKSQAGGAKFHQKFIECDSCYYWYHYGCVGIKPGDRMVGARDFACPPCSSNGANPLVPSGKGVVCARPDCGEASPDEFFVAGIIGRTTKVEGGRGRRYLWLVKWEGYPINQSTWEEEEAMSDPQKLIEEFTAAAEKEGLPDDLHVTLLLKEAVRGGCVDPNT